MFEWTWYLRSLSSLSAWSTLYPMPFESFKQFPAPWLLHLTTWSTWVVGRVGSMGDPSPIPRIPYFRESALLVLFGKGGRVLWSFSWRKTRCFCKTDDFLLELFEKAPNIVSMISFQQTCSIPKMLSHPLVKTKNDFSLFRFSCCFFREAKVVVKLSVSWSHCPLAPW